MFLFPSQDVYSGLTYPATSRVISLTKAVRLERKPFLREILGAGCLGVTSVYRIRVGSWNTRSSRELRTVAGIQANNEACGIVSKSRIVISDSMTTNRNAASLPWAFCRWLSLENLGLRSRDEFGFGCGKCVPRPLAPNVASHDARVEFCRCFADATNFSFQEYFSYLPLNVLNLPQHICNWLDFKNSTASWGGHKSGRDVSISDMCINYQHLDWCLGYIQASNLRL